MKAQRLKLKAQSKTQINYIFLKRKASAAIKIASRHPLYFALRKLRAPCSLLSGLKTLAYARKTPHSSKNLRNLNLMEVNT